MNPNSASHPGNLLWPPPRHCAFSAHTWDGSGGLDLACLQIAHLAPDLRDRLFKLWPPAAAHPSAPRIRVQARLLPGADPSAYQCELSPGLLRLAASADPGFYYALGALERILAGCPTDRLPVFSLEDAPDFPVRGLMLDISRAKVPTVATLEAIIRLLAGLRLNHLQLYVEHTFAFPGHDIVWRHASPLTPGEVRHLDRYARAHRVELTPNLNSFGHLERWLRHPPYAHLAEHPGPFTNAWGTAYEHGTTLRPGPESLAFLDGLYGDYLPCFASPRFNVGCDETWELGRGFSAARAQAVGRHRVYLDFLLQIFALVRRHGRTPLFWADIILEAPDLIPELPADAIGLLWGYEADHPFAAQAEKFARAGLPWWVVPGTSTWRSLTGRLDNALANLAAAAAAGRSHGAGGFLVTDWGDAGHHQFWPFSLPPLFAAAAQAWHGAAFSPSGWEEALQRFAFPDPAEATTTAVLALARLNASFSHRIPNRGLLHEFLFAPPGPLAAAIARTPATEIQAARDRLHAIRAGLASARPRLPLTDPLLEELELAADFAGLALDRASGRFSPSALAALLSRYQACWLARNRPGGLAESIAFFPSA